MIYRIANNLIEIKGLQNEYLEHRLSGYLHADAHAMPDITVTFKYNEKITVPEGNDFQWYNTWYWIDRGDAGYSAIKQQSQTRLTLNRMDFDKDCSNITIEYFNIDGFYIDFSTDRMLHQVLGDAFSFCQTVRGNMLLHSAATSYKGQAVLFSAPSGTGKSTHSGLWKEYYPDDVILFNDDTPIIINRGNELFACGTPWSGKTEINENLIFPLKAVVFLKQGTKNSIRAMTTVEKVVRFLDETKKPIFESLMAKHLEFINNIIKNIPVYELTCDISRDAVDLVKNTIFTEDE